MVPPHPAAAPDDELWAACDVRRVRRSGPGGQNRNKVETGIQLVHRPTGIVAEANERRTQVDNRRVALRRLRRLLALHVRQPAADEPSSLWQERCRNSQIIVSDEHPDFTLLLAEALDVLADCGWSMPDAAAHLHCTSSQLVKLLAREPRALAMVNEARRAQGLSRLR